MLTNMLWPFVVRVLLVSFFTVAMQNELLKVFVIGDSISMHYGPYLKKSLHGFFEYDRKRDQGQSLADLDNPVGANGGDSGMVLKYLQQLAVDENFHTDYLLINCGLHDIKTSPQTGEVQISPEQYRYNLEEIVKLVSEMKLKLVWVTTTPVVDSIHNTKMSRFHRFAKDVDRYNRIALEVVKSHQVPIVDLHSFTQGLGTSIFQDHVHYPEAIREKQADFIAGALSTLRADD